MSRLNLDQARDDYARWVTGTDDPPTLTEEEARLLSFRITAYHFPNLLAAHLALRDKVKALAVEMEARAALLAAAKHSFEFGMSQGFLSVAQRLQWILPTSQGDETSE